MERGERERKKHDFQTHSSKMSKVEVIPKMTIGNYMVQHLVLARLM